MTLLTLRGHGEGVSGLALGSVNGRPVVATSSGDGTALLWDARGGDLLRTLECPSAVPAVALGEVSGRPVVVTGGADAIARLWDGRDGTLLRELRGHDDEVRSVALGDVAGRSVVATSSLDGTARLWDARSGAHLRTLAGHREPVSGVAMGESMVATASLDGTARLWDAATGSPLRTFPGAGVWLTGVAVGALDGRPVAATAGRDAVARLWDARSGELVCVLSGHDGIVFGVAVGMLRGRPVAATAGEDGTARLWDARSGTLLRVLRGHDGWVWSVAVAEIAGLAVVATASEDGTARLWDAGDEPVPGGALDAVRLVVVNGCSVTRGDEHADPGRTAWGAVLARRLSAPCVNLAADGGSNRRIVRTTITHLDGIAARHGVRPEETLYLVMWTKLNRSEVYVGEPDPNPGLSDAVADTGWHRVLPWMMEHGDRRSMAWYRYLQHDAGDRADFLGGWVLLQAWLARRGYRHGFLWAFDPDPALLTEFPELSGQVERDRVMAGPSLLAIGRDLRDLAERGHPMERSHEHYAEVVLYPWLRQLSDRGVL